MSPLNLFSWKKTGQLIIEFFNRLGQLQAPDGDITLTCPLRRLPKIVTTRTPQCPHAQIDSKRKY